FWEIRTQPDVSVADAVRREIAAVDGDVAAADSMMTKYIDSALAARRFTLRVLGAFAVAALLLAAGGLYALVSYATTQRRREIGIRIAMGARPGAVAAMVLRQGVVLASIGVAAGGAVVWALARLTSAAAGDVLAAGAAGVLLVIVAALASWAPARRAARVDPVEALRGE